MAFIYKTFDITLPHLARQVQELQLASYPFEAKLIGLEIIPLMRDTEESLMSCGEQFAGCFEGERLIGAVSYKMIGAAIDIHRMMVHPEWFRRGIAQSLLHLALSQPGASKALISTGTANLPAVQLYKKNGFRETKREVIAPGVTMTFFEKEL